MNCALLVEQLRVGRLRGRNNRTAGFEPAGWPAAVACRRTRCSLSLTAFVARVEILQAATLTTRTTMDSAGQLRRVYARVGRASDAVTLFKTIPMDSASSGTTRVRFGGVAPRTWQAKRLPKRLPLSCRSADSWTGRRFEQGSRNRQRAALWRAALVAMLRVRP